MEERLQKVMAHRGVASRRQCESLIVAGKVKVNGKVVTELGLKVDPTNDKIEVEGSQLLNKESLVYYLLNKPPGYITSVKDERGRKTVMDLLGGVNQRVYPVGRLDYDSAGLLLLTNDGRLAHELMHPRFHVPKTYVVEVKGIIDDESIGKLRQGIKLEDGVTSPAQVEILGRDKHKSILKITIHEGKNRQVRRMLKAVGHLVTKLIRTRIGPLGLGNLPEGEFRTLNKAEIGKLKQAVRRHWVRK